MNTRKKKSRQLSRQYRKYRHKTTRRRRKNTRAKRTRTRTRGKVKRYIRRRKTTKKGSRKKVSMLDVVKKRLKLMNKVNKQIFKRGTQRGGTADHTTELINTLKSLAEILGKSRKTADELLAELEIRSDKFIGFINNSYLLYSNMYSCLRFVQEELKRKRWQPGLALKNHTAENGDLRAPFSEAPWNTLKGVVIALVTGINTYYKEEFLRLFNFIKKRSWPIFTDYNVPSDADFTARPFGQDEADFDAIANEADFVGVVNPNGSTENRWKKEWDITIKDLPETFLTMDITNAEDDDADISNIGGAIANLPPGGAALNHLKNLGYDDGLLRPIPIGEGRHTNTVEHIIGLPEIIEGRNNTEDRDNEIINIQTEKIGTEGGWLRGYGGDNIIFDLRESTDDGVVARARLEDGAKTALSRGEGELTALERTSKDTILHKMPEWGTGTRQEASKLTPKRLVGQVSGQPISENYSHKLVHVLYHTCYPWDRPEIGGSMTAGNAEDRKKFRFERRKMLPIEPGDRVNENALKGVILYINGIIAYHYMARAIYIELLKLKIELYRAWNTVGADRGNPEFEEDQENKPTGLAWGANFEGEPRSKVDTAEVNDLDQYLKEGGA
jgi:hypothetical protein